MAATRSAKYKYQWADGSWHSVAQTKPGPAKGTLAPSTLPPPPIGTYDPAIDYNAGASQRGYGNTQDDAATSYEQGQEDYGIGLGGLTTTRDRRLSDLGTQVEDVKRQYGILGDQQAQAARQHGITSAGLLGLSAAKRAANQQHDIDPLDVAATRAKEDFTTGKTGLDIANARQFGGYGGNTLLDPLTGQPVIGSLLTSLTRAGVENNAFQRGSAEQRAFGAAANGYVPPSPYSNTVNKNTVAAFLKRFRTPVPGPAKGIL